MVSGIDSKSTANRQELCRPESARFESSEDEFELSHVHQCRECGNWLYGAMRQQDY